MEVGDERIFVHTVPRAQYYRHISFVHKKAVRGSLSRQTLKPRSADLFSDLRRSNAIMLLDLNLCNAIHI